MAKLQKTCLRVVTNPNNMLEDKKITLNSEEVNDDIETHHSVLSGEKEKLTLNSKKDQSAANLSISVGKTKEI